MTITELQNFIEVCKEGSASKAAQNLYISRQALSKSLLELETSLGNPLFYRSKSGMILTPFGEQFLEKVNPVYNSLLSLESFAKNYSENIKHVFNIGMEPRSFLESVLFLYTNDFQEKNSNYFIDIVQDTPYNLLSLMESDALSLILLTCPKDMPKADSTEYSLIHKSESSLLLPKNHPLAQKEAVSWKDLGNLALSVPPQEDLFHSLIVEKFNAAGVHPKAQYRKNDLMQIFNYVVSGQGGVICTYEQIASLNTEYITCVKIEDPVVMEYYLLKKKSLNDPAVDQFKQFIIEKITSNPLWN